MIRILVLVFLLLFRAYHLDARPPHHDESVNGWFVDGIMGRGFYIYDPSNYHGPLYFYILAFFQKVFGRDLMVLRWPTIILGWLVNLTPFLFRRWITPRGAWIAAFFLAVSPMMVFFSRYAIHEMAFALAGILFFYYWLRAHEEVLTRELVLGLGMSLGAMACLKENFVLYIAVLLIAEACIRIYERRFTVHQPKRLAIATASIVGLMFLCVIPLYSGFFQDPNGIPNFFRAFYLWSQTGSNGNGHQKPFWYWINLLASLEWFAMLGLLLVPLALKKVPPFLRMTSVMTFGMFLVYSIVSYKTPWCALCFYWGFIFIAAYWVARWMQIPKYKYVLIGVLVAGFSFSATQAYDVAYENTDNDHHLYIYGQTYRDMMPPMNEIIALGKKDPTLHDTLRIQVISQFSWPMPYILGEFKQVGFYGENNAPEFLDGGYVIIDRPLEEKYAPRLRGNYSRQEVRSRQWAAPIVIFKRN